MKNNAYKLIALFPLLLVAFSPEPKTMQPGDTVQINMINCPVKDFELGPYGVVLTIECSK